jgi:hypothetical protein
MCHACTHLRALPASSSASRRAHHPPGPPAAPCPACGRNTRCRGRRRGHALLSPCARKTQVELAPTENGKARLPCCESACGEFSMLLELLGCLGAQACVLRLLLRHPTERGTGLPFKGAVVATPRRCLRTSGK